MTSATKRFRENDFRDPDGVSNEELDRHRDRVLDVLTGLCGQDQASILCQILSWQVICSGMSREEYLDRVGEHYDLLRQRNVQ